MDFACLAKSVRRVIAINQGLPEGQKIRVVSMSIGWMQTSKGYAEISKAVQEAKAAGIFVLSTSADIVYGFNYLGLGRDPLADPDQFGLYGPGIFWASSFYQNSPGYQGMLFVPMDSRTTASPTGPHDYVFYREGGLSWSVPYLAGVYALAAQVKPEITPEEFWSLALKTGRKVQASHDGQRFTLDALLDPAELMKAVKQEELPQRRKGKKDRLSYAICDRRPFCLDGTMLLSYSRL